jgi:16S rRNA processing protein RimM
MPAQDLLIVRPTGAGADGDVMVPFVKAIVPAVDVAAGRVIVTPPAGLFEELPDAAPDTSDRDQSTSATEGDAAVD